jgi:phage terminase large subunit-like protein
MRIVDSYAGFQGDSPILEPMWSRALAGERLHAELPIFGAGRLWSYVDQGEEAQERAWLGNPADREAYYEEQRASLRPGTFARLHENKWQTGSEAFLTAEDWDPLVCEYVVPDLEPTVRAFVGVDAATKRDCAAVVAVGWDESGLLAVIAHRIWIPPKGGTLDLAATIESYVLGLQRRFGVVQVSFDPSQMIRSAQELRGSGVKMMELPQTSGNLTLATQALFDVVKERRLRCYPAPDLRQHVLNSVVVESPRGWRLAKEKASRKIDGAVALSFAVAAAMTGPRGPVGGEMPRWGGTPLSAGVRSAQF